MGEIIELSGEKSSVVIDGDDMREDVCEHCLGGVFKDSGSMGECHIGPPTAGMILVPRQNLAGQVEPFLQPWALFPPVERRHFCLAWEPKDEASQH